MRNVKAFLRSWLARRGQAEETTREQYARELAGLNVMGQTITSTLDLDEVLRLVMVEAKALLQAEAASILLHDVACEELVFAATAGDSAKVPVGTRMPATAGIAGWVMREAEPLLVADAQEDARFYGGIDAVTGSTTRSLVAVPLINKGTIIGVLEAINRAGRVFDDHDLDLLNILAGSAAVAIENARLYKETSLRLVETRVLQEVMLAAVSTLDFDLVLSRAIQTMRCLLGIQYLALALPDETGEYLVLHPSCVGYDSSGEIEVKLPLGASVCGRVFATGKAELIDDVGRDSCYFPAVPGLCSMLAVPVRVENRVIAVLKAEDDRAAAFEEGDLRMFEAIGAHLGLVMENVRLYEVQREQRRLVEQSKAQLVQSEKLAATGRLAASLAHEINNPLQAIHNSLQLMISFSLEPADQRKYLRMADEEVDRLIGMVTRILDFARRPRRELSNTDLNQAVEKVLTLASKYLQHSHVVLQRDLAPDLPHVLAVPDELGQVFLNLVLNAVDAMPDGGVLHVSSRLGEHDRVAVVFSDTGRGIRPEDMDRIFEPFFSTKEDGTGLGLTVSNDVVDRHGGEIVVESVAGEGTTFMVWLPAHAALEVVMESGV